jgi:hypothetical protein
MILGGKALLTENNKMMGSTIDCMQLGESGSSQDEEKKKEISI